MIRIRLIVLAFIALGLAYWRGASAATLSLVGPSSVSLDQTFAVRVVMHSDRETVNAVEGVLTYDPAVLSPVSLMPDNSFVTLWADSPTVPSPGVITMSGGRPDGAVVVDAPLSTVVFRPLKKGSTLININAAQSGVYLHDGFGTKAKMSFKPLSVIVGSALNLLSQPWSLSHPSESQWLPERTLTMQWKVMPDVEVTYRLSSDMLAEPEEYPGDNRGIAVYPNLGDGVWYFTFRERLRGDSWSALFRYAVLIDGTPPEPFTIDLTTAVPGGTPLFTYHADDAASGIAYYRTTVTEWSWWMPWRTKTRTVRTNGQLELQHLDAVRSVTIAAVDRGGNERVVRWNGMRHAREQLLLAGFFIVLALVLSILLFAVVHITHTVRRSLQRRRE